ncbi:MAG: hypothetical protein MI924_29935 [Chloroflexales bacterium]|nr:hypothetical protein [Chloroflexales bacterium]
MLSVRDNGVGLSPEMLENGFGLRGLQDRAQQVGGSLQIDKGVGDGVQVSFVAPIEDE